MAELLTGSMTTVAFIYHCTTLAESQGSDQFCIYLDFIDFFFLLVRK